MIESTSSTVPREDEIILNEGNLRPEYGQREDTAIYDDFRLQGIMSRNLRGKGNTNCGEIQYTFSEKGERTRKCEQTPGCKCAPGACLKCLKCTECVSERDQ